MTVSVVTDCLRLVCGLSILASAVVGSLPQSERRWTCCYTSVLRVILVGPLVSSPRPVLVYPWNPCGLVSCPCPRTPSQSGQSCPGFHR